MHTIDVGNDNILCWNKLNKDTLQIDYINGFIHNHFKNFFISILFN